MTENPNPNPKHKEILDAIPESLHPMVIPVLKKWDQGVQNKFAEIRSEYDDLKAYEPFLKNNIDPAYIEQAVMLADELQREPDKTVKRIHETFKLDYVSKDEIQTPSEDEEFNFGEDGEMDISKHPLVKKLSESIEQLQSQYESEQETRANETALQQFEAQLDALEEQCKNATDEEGNPAPLPFNRVFVTGLMNAGIDGEEAVKHYHEILAGSANSVETSTNSGESSEDPPVVMGGNGAGSGTPESAVNFGEFTKNQLNETVQQIIEQAAQSGQG